MEKTSDAVNKMLNTGIVGEYFCKKGATPKTETRQIKSPRNPNFGHPNLLIQLTLKNPSLEAGSSLLNPSIKLLLLHSVAFHELLNQLVIFVKLRLPQNCSSILTMATNFPLRMPAAILLLKIIFLCDLAAIAHCHGL